MPSQHAKLSPSSADRWLNCPASVRMSMEHAGPKDDHGSKYAMEGTIAHALAELEVGHTFGLISRTEYTSGLKLWRADFDAQNYPEATLEEMQAHVHEFVLFIAQRLKRYPGSKVKTEQRLNTGVPESWGTSDIVIYGLKHIEIIDLKYGMGIQVYADGNSQLRLYACGALDRFGDILADTEEVYITVYQPRLDWHDTEVLSADELRAWRDQVAIPAALETQSPNARFGPSEKACKWCPVAAICTVRMAASVEEDFGFLAAEEPARPEVMTTEELASVLHRLPQIKAWCEAVSDYALDQVYSQRKPIPGWKVVKSGGKRAITDHPGMIKALEGLGHKPEDVSVTKAKPIGVLEKLVGGKKNFSDKLEKYVTKGAGSESLVPADDKREAINPEASAIEDFKGIL